jgi:hypothetical protein
MSYAKENPVKKSGKGKKKVEKPLKMTSKGKGSEFTGPHSDASYSDANPYKSKSSRNKKAKGSQGKSKGMKKGY